ncbi:MAG: SUMF1/EgtB/PvdO family nonheme iron enzyme [Polyangiaceae bacterium]|nr:SUMF1/EgtB/PvdO family nonheme iron enzyme [Polyangiaceae bacterium]
MAEGTLSWLHLSDLRLPAQPRAEWQQLEGLLVDSLRARPDRFDPVDLVLLSGGIAASGTPGCYAEVDRFLERVLGALGPETDHDPGPALIAVPGDSDVAPLSAFEALGYAAFDRYGAPDDPHAVELRRLLWEQRQFGFIERLFSPYLAWRQRWLARAKPGVMIHASPFPGDLAVRIEKPGLGVSLLGLNSAWMQYSARERRGQLELPLEQIQAALPPGPSPLDFFPGRGPSSPDEAILLVHHGLDWLSLRSKESIRAHAYHAERCSVLVHGHATRSSSELLAVSGALSRARFQVGALGSLPGADAPGEGPPRPSYALGQIEPTGRVRVWPFCVAQREDGTRSFDRDQSFDTDEPDGAVLLRPAREIPRRPSAPSRPRMPGPPGPRPGDGHGGVGPIAPAHALTDEELERFRSWAQQEHTRLDLVGIGAADFTFRLEDVYVALGIGRRVPCAEQLPMPHGCADLKRREEREIDILDALAVSGDDELGLFGEPGSGKTTALKKLLCVALTSAPSLGLPADTLPALLRLRYVTAEDLGAEDALGTFFVRQLVAESRGAIGRGLAERVWQRGRVLLLLDGLDEIADEAQRRRVCELLEGSRAGVRARQSRMVVSCRYAGYDELKGVRLGPRFVKLDVKPLSDELIEELSAKWFRAARRAMAGDRSQHGEADAEALKDAQSLLERLRDRNEVSYRIRSLVSTPLLLTLLCVVVLRGQEIPRRRADFYAECLKILLGRWATHRGDQPLCDVDEALPILRHLAYRLHKDSRRDFVLEELDQWQGQDIDRVGRRRAEILTTRMLLDWLVQRAGVIARVGQERYGFVHLGLQEYLCATHMARERLFQELAGHFGEPWWKEVTLLALGQSEHEVFVPLMRELARPDVLTDPKLEQWLVECLDEARGVTSEPFLGLLEDESTDPKARATVLRLFLSRPEPELVRVAATLDATRDHAVQALAQEALLKEKRRSTERAPGSAEPTAAAIESPAYDVFLSYHRKDREVVRRVAEALRQRGIRPWLDEEALRPGRSWLDDLEKILGSVTSAALLLGPGELGPWQEREMRVLVGQLVRRGLPVIPVLLPGASDGKVPLLLEDLTRVDLRSGVTREGVDRLVWGIRGEAVGAAVAEAAVGLAETSLELPTGIRVLHVPGGRFEMGADDMSERERPVHRVRVSPFWLAETPVTNRQYEQFVKATGHRAPALWGRKSFARPEQPVVAVTWHDAVAFCEWVGKESGRPVVLPTEAQWESAARGAEGRKYPWGDQEPDKTRAWFGQSYKTGPGEVGSLPAGRGPFGHLDLAGNVWEWCRDVWDSDAYAKRAKAKQEVVDPEVTGKGDMRCLRGGCFISDAQFLRSAFRNWNLAEDWYWSIGLRVALLPASVDS